MTGERELEMSLRYRHGFGELLPYFEGLQAGRAMATCCDACGRVWFAPRLTCACSGGKMSWTELPGTGEIAAVTSTSTPVPLSPLPLTPPAPSQPLPISHVGLIRMHGAGNAVFGRIVGDGIAVGRRVRLSASETVWVHPVQAAQYLVIA